MYTIIFRVVLLVLGLLSASTRSGVGRGLLVLIFLICLFTFGSEKLRGINQLCSGNPQEAIIHYKRELTHTISPQDFYVRYWLGMCYWDLKQYDNVITEYSNAIDIYNKAPFIQFVLCKPTSWCKVWRDMAWMYEYRGIAYMILHNYDQAVTDYTESIRYSQKAMQFDLLMYMMPHRPPGQYARYLRSLCYYANGQQALAEQDTERLQKEHCFESMGSWLPVAVSPATRSNFYDRIQCIVKNKSELMCQ